VHLQETFLDPIAPIARVSGQKQRLASLEAEFPSLIEKARRKRRRQGRVYGCGSFGHFAGFQALTANPCPRRRTIKKRGAESQVGFEKMQDKNAAQMKRMIKFEAEFRQDPPTKPSEALSPN
jgi:hypothetical protein